MTREELAQFNGKEGRKAYVAVNGKVYDFTDSDLWENGLHQDQHQAGKDLTRELMSAPHVRAVVERFPVVDRLEDPPPPQKKSSKPLLWIVLAIVVALIVSAWILR